MQPRYRDGTSSSRLQIDLQTLIKSFEAANAAPVLFCMHLSGISDNGDVLYTFHCKGGGSEIML